MTARESFEIAVDGGAIRGDTFLPRGATRTVIICHGWKGFARWGFFPLLAERCADAGLRAITFDFSGSGIGADRETFAAPEAFAGNTYTRELRDLATVIADGEKRGWIDRRYAILGHSRGGGIAILHTAGNDRVSALVTWAGISAVRRPQWTDDVVRDWRRKGTLDVVNTRTGKTLPLSTALLDEVEAEETDTLDIAAAATKVRAPWLIVHGTKDESVPFAEAERLSKQARLGHAMLFPVPGAGHTFGATHPLPDSSLPDMLERAISRTVDFLTEHTR